MIIFAHDNGNLNILSMPKCGHTAMWDYFDLLDIRQTRTFAHWLEGVSPKVVVLRHPAQRMHSSIAFYNEVWNTRSIEYQKTGKCFDFPLMEFWSSLNSTDCEWEIEEFIFNQHCRPYMHILKNRDFRIIKFEELPQYIPTVLPGGIATNTTDRSIDPFPLNRWFTRKDMLKEIELYENLLVNREVITVEEWKALT
jgi:hypothetical protein